MAEYLVTGGAGFIGSHLVEALVNQGKQVAVIDNLVTGKYENIAPFIKDVVFYEGTICDLNLLKQALQGVKVVFHEAAIPSVQRSVQDPWATHQANVEGTFHVLMAAKEAGVKRIVYAGSSSAYGDTVILPKVETMCPRPLSPYAASKLTGEYYCKVFSQVYGIETVVLRYFNVFGPRQDVSSDYAAVIPKFICALLQHRPPTIYGDGEQTRDFTYISNVVTANLLAAQGENISGMTFNIACGQQISLNQLLHSIAQLLGQKAIACYQACRPGDVRHSLADISLARTYLRYEPAVDLVAGLEKTIGWFQQHRH